MVRLSFNPVEGFTSASDFDVRVGLLVMICSAVAFHTNGFGSVFQCSAHSVIAAVRSATLVNTPRRSRLSFSSLNQRSIRLSHELEVAVKCKCQRRRVLVRQPLLHLGRGVGIRGRRWCPFARPEVPVRA